MRFPRATRQVVLKIAGVKHWLWRAVDQTGIVLDVLVQRRRDKKAAKRLLRKLLKRHMRPPRVMITDKLASYGAAKREVMPGIEHRQHKALNNRAENSHQPTRRRERQMKQFKSAGQAVPPEREPEIQPDGVADNLGGEPITGIAGAGRCHHPTRLPTPVRFRKRRLLS